MSASNPSSFGGLRPDQAAVVAEIGERQTTTAWIGPDGQVHARTSATSNSILGAQAVLDVALAGLNAAREDARGAGMEPVAIGVAVAGVVDDGRVTRAPESFVDWIGTDLSGALKEAARLPVAALGTAHAQGVGEAEWGAGGGRASVLFVSVGRVISGAIVTRGRLLTGAGSAAGAVGHVSVPEAAGVTCPCGRTGHLEAIGSGAGILRAYKTHGASVDTTREMFARAADGQNLARNVIADCAFATGRVIGDLLNVLDVEVAVIGGRISETGEVWWEGLRRGVSASVIDPVIHAPVVPALLGTEAALIGAGHHGLMRR